VQQLLEGGVLDRDLYGPADFMAVCACVRVCARAVLAGCVARVCVGSRLSLMCRCCTRHAACYGGVPL
jgi:hypothetical protein